VFACGGGIYTSAVDAAKKVEGAKVIGVDVDQAAIITAYAAGSTDAEELAKWENLTVTSAMKGLEPATIDALTDVVINDKWDNYAGKIVTLGLVSEDPALNYVQIAGSTQFEDGKFTAEDYKTLVKGMLDGTIVVSADIAAEPAVTNTTVEYLGNIK
ncbi:MAG: BMP family ABC transporter substrate-binding protein, partial [Clostridia bacterium]|nr:BMP family ABC transporter substrate-binding protein [Clostridia bacterium]